MNTRSRAEPAQMPLEDAAGRPDLPAASRKTHRAGSGPAAEPALVRGVDESGPGPIVASALTCGVDEAGRGPLAGPVFAAAVILDPARPIDGLKDSKKLTAKRRDALADLIRGRALAWSIASASVDEIDALNILQATMLAMKRAVEGLAPSPVLARVDGNRAPRLRCAVETLIGGDALDPAISAASILAKTARDALLVEMHARWPEYRFDVHKGYPTAAHLALLREHGPCPEHRRSFGPVRAVLAAASPAEIRP